MDTALQTFWQNLSVINAFARHRVAAIFFLETTQLSSGIPSKQAILVDLFILNIRNLNIQWARGPEQDSLWFYLSWGWLSWQVNSWEADIQSPRATAFCKAAVYTSCGTANKEDFVWLLHSCPKHFVTRVKTVTSGVFVSQ